MTDIDLAHQRMEVGLPQDVALATRKHSRIKVDGILTAGNAVSRIENAPQGSADGLELKIERASDTGRAPHHCR